MFTRNISHLLLGGLLAFGVACDSKDDKKDDKKADAKDGDKKADAKADAKADGGEAKADDGEAKEAPADGPAEIVLEQVGLKATAPAGAKASDGIGGGVMVQAPGLVVTVAEAKDDSLATADKAKEDADMYTPENWTSEDVEGGYVATFENKGGMGTNFWVKSYRKIGEKGYLCDTTANSAEQQKAAAEFCKSLAAK
jgi:hypothetical protein